MTIPAMVKIPGMLNIQVGIWHIFISIQDIETIFAYVVAFLRSANSNMLSEFFREQMNLP